MGPLTHTKGAGVGEEGEEDCYRMTAVDTCRTDTLWGSHMETLRGRLISSSESESSFGNRNLLIEDKCDKLLFLII